MLGCSKRGPKCAVSSLSDARCAWSYENAESLRRGIQDSRFKIQDSRFKRAAMAAVKAALVELIETIRKC